MLAKAVHVTSESECRRRFGSLAKTKTLVGEVLEVITARTATGRVQTNIRASYMLDDNTRKTKTINIRSLKAFVPDFPQNVPNFPQNATNGPTATTEPIAAPPTATAAQSTATAAQLTATTAQLTATTAQMTAATAQTTAATAQTTAQTTTQTTATDQTTAAATAQPAAVCHGQEWYKDDYACINPIGLPVPFREWFIRTKTGDCLGPKSFRPQDISRLDVFLMMFPPKQLELMARETSIQLEELGAQPIRQQELLKFFGILLLATKFEFGSRASLWSTVAIHKYQPAPCFGATGMSRHRFDTIWRCLRFSVQPATRPNHLSHEAYRWMLVDDFVSNFNDYRRTNFGPSDLICVDESISRWYGLGGDWINIGLPMYVSIDRKPEDGCEIQDAACGRSGIMIRLKLVKTKTQTESEPDDDRLHGTSVLKELLSPWFHTYRLACADSYFSSVEAALALKEKSFSFIGVVKTATTGFPKAQLSAIQMSERGERKGLISYNDDGTPKLMAFVWMDRERRYFISSTSSLDEGEPYSRTRWRQVDETENAEPEKVDLSVPQPKVCEIYYKVCGKVDRHNRSRQDNLMLERKLGTQKWYMRVGMSLLGICLVDAWMAYSQLIDGNTEKQSTFYSGLAEELIDNRYDSTSTRRRATSGDESSPSSATNAYGKPRTGVGIHLTPTKRKRRTADGVVTNHSLQGHCRVCRKKTKFTCSYCYDHGDGKEFWLCGSETGRTCFPTHLEDHQN